MMKKTKPKCAIYCRVSTQVQKETQNIEGQRLALKEYAESQGWQVTGVYEDEGISGAFLAGRADFQRLLQDMEAKKFDILLVTETSRITRSEDPVERAVILRTIQRSACKVASPASGIESPDSFEGELLFSLKGLFSAKEKKDIAERMQRGKQARLKKGQYCLPSIPYGLKRVTITDDDGKRLKDSDGRPMPQRIEFNEDEGRILRKVFEQITAEGMSMNDCSHYLNEKGIKPRRGKRWTPGNLSRILRQDALTGTIYCNRFKWEKLEPGPDGKPRQRLVEIRPKSEGLPVPVPATFTEEEFKFLRECIEQNRIKSRRDKVADRFLLKGHLRCERCGRAYGPYSTTGHDYYVCRGRVESARRRKPGERQCRAPYVPASKLDRRVVGRLIKELIRKPDSTIKKWTGKRGRRKSLENLKLKMGKTDTAIRDKEKKLERLIDLYTSGTFTMKQVKAKKAHIEGELSLLREKREDLANELEEAGVVQANAESIDRVKAKLKGIRKRMRPERGGAASRRLAFQMDEMPFEDKQRLLGAFFGPTGYIEIFTPGKAPDEAAKWDWTFHGSVYLEEWVRTLDEYLKTGKIPHTYDYKSPNYAMEYRVK